MESVSQVSTHAKSIDAEFRATIVATRAIRNARLWLRTSDKEESRAAQGVVNVFATPSRRLTKVLT